MTESKSVALPLGYSPKITSILVNLNCMGRSMGLEPMHAGITIRCVNQLRHDRHSLHYHMPKHQIMFQKTQWWRGTDSNRRTLRERIYSPPRLATSLPLQKRQLIFYKKMNNPSRIIWWCWPEDLNPQPTDYKSVALPIELGQHTKWWLETESNRRHEDFQSSALPTELSSQTF